MGTCRLQIERMTEWKKRWSSVKQIGSVTRWLDYFSIFGHLEQEKVAQKYDFLPKWGQNFVKH